MNAAHNNRCERPTLDAPAELTRHRNFELVKDQIEREDDLINRRMTWLITRQTIFFGFYCALYSFAIDKSLLDRISPLILTFSIVALSACVLIFAGNVAAAVTLWGLRKQLDDFYTCEPRQHRPIPNVSRKHSPNHYAGLVAPIAVPAFFIGTWLWLLLFHFG